MFLKLTSAYGGILLVNMDHIITVQKIDRDKKHYSILTRLDGSIIEVTESFEEICRMMEAK